MEARDRWTETKKKAEHEGIVKNKEYDAERTNTFKKMRAREKSKSRTIYQTLMGNKEMVSNAADTLTP